MMLLKSWSDTVVSQDTLVNKFIHNTDDEWLGTKRWMAKVAHNFFSLFL